jgi:uncharacterized protein DUF1549/uncharacterized protein DUF1553
MPMPRLLLFLTASLALAAPPQRLLIEPANPLLFGKGSRQMLVVVARYADGTQKDVTREARLRSERPAVASLDDRATLTASANGAAVIRASWSGLEASTTALVQRAAAPLAPSFNADVMPVLTKIGCNGGSCHGALNGQAGFKLSLFGYEPDADFEMIVHKHDGRRLNLSDPANSLLLQKPTFRVKHGGGKLLKEGSPEYSALLEWIRGGARLIPENERRIVSLRVLPEGAVLAGKDSTRQLLVSARFSDGTERDVTRLVKFQSNDDSIAKVNSEGVVTAERGGETAIVVRAPGATAAAKVGVVITPRQFPAVEANNFIDEYVFAKLRDLQIPPSEPCDDATFLRRASLDITGIIPTSSEARAFLDDPRPGKRARLVDALLKRPEYADFWSLYWGDHLNNTKQLLYNKGPYTFTRWLYDAFRRNLPYDQFARELLTSSGNMFEAAATSYYPLMKKELDLAAISSQLFLGVSIECARCHNHPLERWTQNDFFGMAAFFGQIRYKGAGPRNNERVLYVDFDRIFVHPDTKKAYLPKALDGPAIEPKAGTDYREMLADWMTSPSNPFFSRAIVNRMWRNFMGRGLVEPVDDFRVTNPPTNEPLLNALAKDFVEHSYDLHHLIRVITASKAYQLSSVASEANRDDRMAYSRYFPRRLTAEQLADSISLATGVPEHYNSLYPGTRASQLPEPEIDSYFLEVFDRPSRQLICERKQPPTLNQALHLIAGDTIQRKITDPKSVVPKLSALPAGEAVEEIYLRTLSRRPDSEERSFATAALKKSGSSRGLEDILWAVLNSREFLYNH